MNKVHSFSQMESNIAPFYYEPAAIESKASIKFIPKPREIENNQWFRQNILKKTSLEFIDMNRNPNIDNNEEKHVESSYGAPIIDQNLKKEKEHEELLESIINIFFYY